ncbi:SMI1/KNR4 family protein [Leucobacter viscericola]|uniref:SMI1/KNR4 family protein n=1 Tax=Leucobacter viscericola TaxID=2714935 RepID=A0A6G7XBX4_9MICO|nr:SMI1/KNR4 family protein [Leucobacter viscericola]QIK61966.1 SMI1/KNR4 family protein [Leucobacter viscericola]
MTDLTDETGTELWIRAARALRAEAPPGTAVSQFSGTVSRSSWGGSYEDDGDFSARSDRSSDDGFMDALSAVNEAQEDRQVGVNIRIEATGKGEVTLLRFPASVETGSSRPINSIVLVPGAMPETFRREAVLPEQPTIEPKSEYVQRITELVERRMPDAVGAPDTLIEAVEQRLGVPLPAEVRALYRAAASGDLILSDDEDATGFYGFDIIALDDTEQRDAYTPENRFFGWASNATEVAATAPSGAVQPLAGSPYWFPLANDWGGNMYAVDLAPGPEGVVGQILFLDHEQSAGAVRITESLGELLLADEAPKIPWAENQNPVVYVNDRSGKTIAEIADEPIASLNIGEVSEPVDLEPLLRESSPAVSSLRYLKVAAGSLASPQQVSSFTNLEFLELAPAEWRLLLEHDAVPPTLLAASVSGNDLLTTAELSNRLLAARSQPLISSRVIQVDLGAEDADHSAAPGSQIAPPKPRKRRWFGRG